MDDLSELTKICALIQDPKKGKKYLEGKSLESELSELEGDLKEIEKNLSNVLYVMPVVSDEPTKQIQSSNLRLLHSAFNAQPDLLLYPQLPGVQTAALKSDLMRNIKDMEEINSSLEATLSEKRATLTRLLEVRDNMKLYKEELGNSVNSVAQKQQTVDSLKNKLSALKETHRELFPDFGEYIEKQFPPITDLDVKRYRKEFPSTRLKSSNHLLSMTDMLEKLLNACRTDNSYILTDESTWPPYVDLLAASGIIQFHPDDSRYFSLCDF